MHTVIRDTDNDNYKYPGTVADNELSFGANTDTIWKKLQQRLYFLQNERV